MLNPRRWRPGLMAGDQQVLMYLLRTMCACVWLCILTFGAVGVVNECLLSRAENSHSLMQVWPTEYKYKCTYNMNIEGI